MRGTLQVLTMNIERRFFADIVAGTKRVEYRKVKPFWTRRIEPLTTPFKLRLLNGMTHTVPEAVVMVTRVTRDWAGGEYRLGLIRFRRQLNYAADFTVRAALSNSAGLT
jgi:hypothetical protein